MQQSSIEVIYAGLIQTLTGSQDLTARLAIDAGGVLMPRVKDGVYFDPYPLAYETIHLLGRIFLPENIFIISRRKNQEHERNFLNWLEQHKFHAITGLGPDNVLICRESENKVALYTELKITHLIFDRARDARNLPPHVHKLYMFRPTEQEKAALHQERIDSPVIIVNEWKGFENLFTAQWTAGRPVHTA